MSATQVLRENESPANAIKWASTALMITAGLALALNFELSKYGFLLFGIAHIMLTVVFFRHRDWAMMAQNLFFLGIDVVGIIKWF